MKLRISACVVGLLVIMSCNKKQGSGDAVIQAANEVAKIVAPFCGKEIVTDQPVKVGETGFLFPAKSRLCFSSDSLQIQIELPPGYAFMLKGEHKTLPVWVTYACYCSVQGSACQVFFAEGLGFGCLQSTCSGSCTGKFTYKGYTLDKIVPTTDKESFFNLPEVQKEIAAITSDEPFSRQTVYGISFYLVNDIKKFMAAVPTCDCEGTQACKLKTISMLGKKIYFCEGTCNGCELTV